MSAKRAPPSIHSGRPGFAAPVVSADSSVKVSAWLDTDKPSSRPRYHVVVRQRGGVEHDFFSMSTDRIKSLGEQLLALHAQLAAPK